MTFRVWTMNMKMESRMSKGSKMEAATPTPNATNFCPSHPETTWNLLFLFPRDHSIATKLLLANA